ncbi:hypothetical protein LCGC14_0404440 [marine sediment metagenome]|uniref:Uncharacterized protein n=1 Tax=marine sediment metagenome TaxID=412755 RepID=A0A0F9SW08_9ZZZZ
MAKLNKPIHLIIMSNCVCRAVCDWGVSVIPVDKNIIKRRVSSYYSLGIFNPKKVICKRCLKHSDYKTAMDKVNNPLFYWKEGV